ncbi:hypothetical protein BDK51DRAFT_53269 [Blyttiomyces helicus]|uniref:Galactose oxidase n=1 Tax=Blyttiomyces helicus TaxID=388810 RepID=A0A4P9W6M4_9FUNG|nr:hypothetical protein BDK51DRAFT_53269 [Blyttiomyces helicus]|eukprot:RKO87023.1 hypothetical protein BDK51DRAFT_53269 [Blyttiomyces helicus]
MRLDRASRLVLPFLITAAWSQEPTPVARQGANLATGPNGLVLLGGKPETQNLESAPILPLWQALSSAVVTCSFANQTVSVVNTPNFNNLLATDGQACAQSGSQLFCNGGQYDWSSAGGLNNKSTGETSVNSALAVFDLSALSWDPNPVNLTTIPKLAYHSMTLLGETAYIFGGSDQNSVFYNSVYSFPINGSASPIQVQPQGTLLGPGPRYSHCGAAVGSQEILVYGGYGGASQSSLKTYNDTYLFNPTASAWSSYPTDPGMGGRTGTACTSVNSNVYLFGGVGPSNNDHNDLWMFDGVAKIWKEVNVSGNPPSIRSYASMTSVGSSWLVVTGGEHAGVSDDSNFYFFNLATSKWYTQTVGSSLNGSLPTPSPSPSSTHAPASPTLSGPSTGFPNPSSNSSSSSSSSVSAGAVAGGVVGGVVVVLAVASFVWRWRGAAARKSAAAHIEHTAQATAPAAQPDATVYRAETVGGELPPAYDGTFSGSNRAESIPKVEHDKTKVYRGLCTFSPSNADEIPVKLGDEILIMYVVRGRG